MNNKGIIRDLKGIRQLWLNYYTFQNETYWFKSLETVSLDIIVIYSSIFLTSLGLNVTNLLQL